MTNFMKTKRGIIAPREANDKRGYQCGFCPNVIRPHNEANGMLHVKSGVPICARCRILTRSPLAAKIKADKKKFAKDVIERDQLQERNEQARIEEVAAASQIRAGGDSKKKKKLAKTLHKN